LLSLEAAAVLIIRSVLLGMALQMAPLPRCVRKTVTAVTLMVTGGAE